MKKLRDIRIHTSTFVGVTFLFGLLMFVAAWKFSFASYAMDLEEDSSPVSETVTVVKRVDAAEPDEKTSDLEAPEEETRVTEKDADSKKDSADVPEEKKETETVSETQETEPVETTVSEETSSVQTESVEEAEPVQTSEPEVVQTPDPEPVDPYAGYSYGLGYNGRMKGYSYINSYDSYASDPSAWTSAVQATVDSGTICRCGNYFAGHNPGVMSFISGISTGDRKSVV